MGNTEFIDTTVHDGLTDAFDKIHMGITGEKSASHLNKILHLFLRKDNFYIYVLPIWFLFDFWEVGVFNVFLQVYISLIQT